MATAHASGAPPVPGAAPVFAAAALRAADRRATSRHRIPSILLMDRASHAAAATVRGRFPDDRSALILCGPGNNGGDGYAVARHLADAGWQVEIATPRGGVPATPDAMTMATIARSVGLRPRAFTPDLLERDRIVIDALLGIGGSGAPRGAVGTVIGALQSSLARVVALDVPSGIDADTGEVPGRAVRAVHTVTFHGDKPGLHITPGRDHAGEVTVADIGIPPSVVATPAGWTIGANAGVVPAKSVAGDKYGAGAVLVVAGSPGLTGAGILSSRAALHTGAGLVVVAAPAQVQPVMAAGAAEVMVAAIPDDSGFFTSASIDAVVAQAARVGAVALGPGLGREATTTRFVREVCEAITLPLVIDADGLWHLSPRPAWLRRRDAPTVITPHSGEAARLLDTERDAVEAARLAMARRLADRTGAITILKGRGSIIADPEGTVLIDTAGTTALATAGSGDVLTGIVATLLAKRLPALGAAATGVAVHARAGVLTGHGDGTIAGDLIDVLPEAVAPRG
jgi:NAD(P)H-hydrate epimerase